MSTTNVSRNKWDEITNPKEDRERLEFIQQVDRDIAKIIARGSKEGWGMKEGPQYSNLDTSNNILEADKRSKENVNNFPFFKENSYTGHGNNEIEHTAELTPINNGFIFGPIIKSLFFVLIIIACIRFLVWCCGCKRIKNRGCIIETITINENIVPVVPTEDTTTRAHPPPSHFTNPDPPTYEDAMRSTGAYLVKRHLDDSRLSHIGQAQQLESLLEPPPQFDSIARQTDIRSSGLSPASQAQLMQSSTFEFLNRSQPTAHQDLIDVSFSSRIEQAQLLHPPSFVLPNHSQPAIPQELVFESGSYRIEQPRLLNPS